eukprot:jgi/Ulvmu1/7018/UM033_0077.1
MEGQPQTETHKVREVKHKQRKRSRSKPNRASGSLPAVGTATGPMEPDPNEAKRSTVEAAFPLFRQSCPDFGDEDLKNSLAVCWKIDVTVNTLIEEAFEYLISRKFGGVAACPDQDGAPIAPAEGAVDPDNEDDAFESERAQMRAAMRQSEAEAAAYNAVHQKPEQQWSCTDYQEQFPSSAILKEVDKEGQLGTFCCNHVRAAALALLRLEKKCCKWWRREPGVHGYFRALSGGIVEACRGMLPLLTTFDHHLVVPGLIHSCSIDLASILCQCLISSWRRTAWMHAML